MNPFPMKPKKPAPAFRAVAKDPSMAAFVPQIEASVNRVLSERIRNGMIEDLERWAREGF